MLAAGVIALDRGTKSGTDFVHFSDAEKSASDYWLFSVSGNAPPRSKVTLGPFIPLAQAESAVSIRPMLKRILQAFRASEPEPLPELDTELALGALLVRVARSDQEYHVEEISLIDRILAEIFNHGPIEAAKIRATCERLHAAAPETKVFAALIRDDMDLEHRLQVLEAIWKVVLADGTEQEAEIAVADSIRNALGLTPAESDEIRDRVQSVL